MQQRLYALGPAAKAPMPSQPLLVARDLARSYGHGDDVTHALQGASLEVNAGELVAIQGRSGSGKTTFLNLASGLDQADGGSIELFGHDLGGLSTNRRLELRAQEIGFVFQDPALVPELTLWENVAMAARIKGLPAKQCKTQAYSALADVGLEGLEDRFPGEISGGEAQRASVARALAKQPRLILADEPTAALDHETARRVAKVFTRFVQENGTACLVVTHDDIMAAEAVRTYHLEDGRMRRREA